jgi:glycerol-3-phosphate dehydrogenase
MADTNSVYDLLIIGGGINGCGIAADAAGRGLSVYLCEKNDLASHTSSASSKMIHGGLRYLEYYEFRLVREALAEREVLLKIAPHIIQPLRLVIPHNSLQRPRWLIRLGLWLYDHLGFHFRRKTTLPRSNSVKLDNQHLIGMPLKQELTSGFAYSDCKVDDARLVVLNALQAQQHGANINLHTEFISAKRENGIWHAIVRNAASEFTIQAKALINAAGPWVDHVVQQQVKIKPKHHIDLVKGSHIVFPKLYQGDHAYLLQHTDNRVVFVIPYHHNFTMVGTTDVQYHDDPNQVSIDIDETTYLCEVVNHYFNNPVSANDIVNTWSGVRPLQADDSVNPSAVTRDYTLEVHDDHGQAPILSVYGGKITTYRRLAEHAIEKLKKYFNCLAPSWTATKPLPGGDLPNGNLNHFILQLQQNYPALPISLLTRWASAYGSNVKQIAAKNSTVADLGQLFGADLYQREVDYLIQTEWAQSTDDILWRRSKLGLYFSAEAVEILHNYLCHHNKNN